MASLSITKIGDQTYKWEITGLSNPFTPTYYHEAGITDKLFSDSVVNLTGIKVSTNTPTVGNTDKSTSGYFTITENGTYTFYGFVRVTNPNYYYWTASSATITHTNPTSTRPNNFYWAVSIAPGQPIKNLTATEWARFQNRINEFRAYKGKGSWSFSNPYQNGTNYAVMMRECADAIYDISSALGVASVCRTAQRLDKVYAWYYDNLSTALNNVT